MRLWGRVGPSLFTHCSLSVLLYPPCRSDCGVEDRRLPSGTAAPSRSLQPDELLDTALSIAE